MIHVNCCVDTWQDFLGGFVEKCDSLGRDSYLITRGEHNFADIPVVFHEFPHFLINVYF